MTSTDPSSISNENSYGILETPSSPTKPSSPEENAQEIYPWMKEFRSKGTKKIHTLGRFVLVFRKRTRDTKWAWVD